MLQFWDEGWEADDVFEGAIDAAAIEAAEHEAWALYAAQVRELYSEVPDRARRTLWLSDFIEMLALTAVSDAQHLAPFLYDFVHC